MPRSFFFLLTHDLIELGIPWPLNGPILDELIEPYNSQFAQMTVVLIPSVCTLHDLPEVLARLSSELVEMSAYGAKEKWL
jgi:hypothetical protein